MGVKKTEFGSLSDGRTVKMFTIENKSGMSVSLIDYGATIVSLKVPNRDGNISDIVCGYDDIASYENANGYQGATIGRVANRIGKGKLPLRDFSYQLNTNNNENHLHGGNVGFDKKIWDAQTPYKVANTVVMKYVSPDGEENYPGKLTVSVTYTLTEKNVLVIHYDAVTDRDTVINLTNHSYFNLGGYDSGSILDHVLTLDADTYLPTDKGLIPTGEIKSVQGSPFDFRAGKTVGENFFDEDNDLKIAGGYDHCFNFTSDTTKGLCNRVTLYDKKSGRKMNMVTNYPSVQVYTANFMDNKEYPFKNNVPQEAHNAICLEAQYKPDSVNHQGFDDITLRVGEVYNKSIILEFSVE
jgi:aldose 1-epimerase